MSAEGAGDVGAGCCFDDSAEDVVAGVGVHELGDMRTAARGDVGEGDQVLVVESLPGVLAEQGDDLGRVGVGDPGGMAEEISDRHRVVDIQVGEVGGDRVVDVQDTEVIEAECERCHERLGDAADTHRVAGLSGLAGCGVSCLRDMHGAVGEADGCDCSTDVARSEPVVERLLQCDTGRRRTGRRWRRRRR